MSDLPQKIHRYEFVKRLGRGGMGELYLARDPLLGRYVAIKVLRAGFEGDELRERFAREARSAARLAHVNIVTIFDVGEHEGMPYIAMEFVPGETLSQIIRRKPDLPLGTKLNHIDELCAGLAHAHRAGIVHRDIKPANLMLSADGTLKILDFGIARLVDSSMTEAGMVMGTLNYMSPEQLGGQPIDHRSDIFAVGAVFYELIAYQQAFPGGMDTGVLSRIMECRFTPLTTVDSRIDPNLSRVIDKALAKNPDDRYADLTAMREDLARVRQRMDRRLLHPQTVDENDDKTIIIETPLGTPRTPRKGTDRSEIHRRREEELSNSLNAAREAFADGRYDEASAACERALIIQPENEEALNLIERAREAIERQQLHGWINQAQTAFDRGDLIRARDLVSFALSLDAASPDAGRLRAAIEKAAQRNELDSAVERGRAALTSGDAAGAMAAAQEALRLDPTDEHAGALKRDVDAFVARQRKQAEDDRRAREIVPEARRRFAKGEIADAIALLQAFSPPHAAVTAALQELRTEAKAVRERELERERQVAAELQQARAALANDDVIAAAAAVARARGVSPAHHDVTAVGRAIDARRAELAAKKKAEEDARRLAEELARLRAEEEARERAAEEARRKEEDARRAEQARRKAEEERRLAEQQARLRAEHEARERAEEAQRKEDDARRAEQARRKAEEERRLAEQQARLRAEHEARERAEEAQRKEDDARRAEQARRKAEEERRLAEQQARAEHEARERAEEARRKEEDARRAEQARRKAEEERRQADEARRLKEEQDRLAAEEEKRRKAEEAAREKAEEARLKAEAEERRQAEEAKRKADAEAKRKADDEKKRLAEEERRRKAEEDRLRKEADQRRQEEERLRKEEEQRVKAREEQHRKAEEEQQRKAEEDQRQKAEQARRAEEARAKSTPAVTAVDPAPEVSDDTTSLPTLVQPPSDRRPPQPAPAVGHVPPPAIERRSLKPPLGLFAAAAVVVAALAGGIYWAMSGDDPPVVNSSTAAVTSVVTSVPPTTTTIPAGIQTGLLVIDASPWAEIVEIVGDNGQVKLPAPHTPLAVTVPEGEYRITLRNPRDRSPQTVTARVTTGQPGRAFAEFSAVDVDAYFRRSGTQPLDGR